MDIDRARLTSTAARDRPQLAVGPPLPVAHVAALGILPAAVLVVFYLWPTATLIVRTIDLTAIGEALSRRSTWSTMWFTTWQAVLSTVVTVVFGLPAAHVVARYRFPGRSVFLGALTAVFVLPTVVVGAAFLALLPSSVERTTVAVIAAHVVFNLAVVVRTVAPAWERLPVDLEGAAATLGASWWKRQSTIALPLLRPAIGAAAIIVFLFSFTSYGVVRVLGAPGTRTIEVEVWRRATQLDDLDGAAVLAILQLLVLASLALATNRHQRRSAEVFTPATPRRGVPHRAHERRAVAAVVAVTGAAVVVPLVALVLSSVRSTRGWSLAGWTRLGDQQLRPGLRLGIDPIAALSASLTTAAWSTAMAVAVGALATLTIASTGRLGRTLDAGWMLPLGTSAVTIGFGMLITFAADPFDWRASWWIVPLGHALIAVPFVIRVCVGVLRSIDPELLAAAATLGAGPSRAWAEVVVPHLWRPLLAGGALAAAISLGEFGATSLLSRTGRETLPIAIERLLGRTGSLFQAQAAVLATLLAIATIMLVTVAERAGRLEAER